MKNCNLIALLFVSVFLVDMKRVGGGRCMKGPRRNRNNCVKCYLVFEWLYTKKYTKKKRLVRCIPDI